MFDRTTIRKFYVRILAFYPRAFRSQFEESARDTFDDLLNEREQKGMRITFGFVCWIFIETFTGVIREHATEAKTGWATMDHGKKATALIALTLAMPLAIILFVEISGVEPLRGFLAAITTEAGSDPRLSSFGKVFLLGALFLVPVGLVVSVVPLFRDARSGRRLVNSPANLFVGIILLIFTATLVVHFVIDQYPCWMGVPNCD